MSIVLGVEAEVDMVMMWGRRDLEVRPVILPRRRWLMMSARWVVVTGFWDQERFEEVKFAGSSWITLNSEEM